MRILHLVLVFCFSAPALAETGYEATAKLVGTYKGEWTVFALDANGQIFEKSKWVDTLIEENPQNDGERPTVDAIDTITFPNGKIIVSRFQEGFYTNSEGQAGDRYTINHDVITTYTSLDPETWVFQYRLSDAEMQWFGFEPSLVTTASHVIVRSRTYAADGKETYNVTRLTAVQWHDKDGQERFIQFVSMKGYHRRER